MELAPEGPGERGRRWSTALGLHQGQAGWWEHSPRLEPREAVRTLSQASRPGAGH